MPHFPLDFMELIIDGFIDTGCLSSAIAKAELRKNRELAQHTILNESQPAGFKFSVANGQLECRCRIEIEVGDLTLKEKFVFMLA